jgi:hypothetical protein
MRAALLQAEHAGVPYTQLAQDLKERAASAARQGMAHASGGSGALLSCAAVVVPGCAQLLLPLACAEGGGGAVSGSVLDAIASQILASFPAAAAESAGQPGLEMLHVQLGSELMLPGPDAGADDTSARDPGTGYVAVPSAGQWGHWGLQPVCLAVGAEDGVQSAAHHHGAGPGQEHQGAGNNVAEATVLRLSFDPGSSSTASAASGSDAAICQELSRLLRAAGSVRVVAQQGGAVLLDRQLPLEPPTTGAGGDGQEEVEEGCWRVRWVAVLVCLSGAPVQ